METFTQKLIPGATGKAWEWVWVVQATCCWRHPPRAMTKKMRRATLVC